MQCDMAFMGGGVRGIAFSGAISSLENSGYSFRRVAGVSAGAIAAALVASGFSGQEIKQQLQDLDYSKFKKRDYVKLGPLRDFVNLRRDLGIFSADTFENWLATLLKTKGVVTFKDIKGRASGKRLQLTAADIDNKRLLVLPQDLVLFGLDPDTFSVATAVRMSMSIPVFYEPYNLIDSNGNSHLIVDGGIFCNYPIWLLDDGCGKTEVPVFGAKFSESNVNCIKKQTRFNKKFCRLTSYLKQIISAALDATGHGYARTVAHDKKRTINIDVCINGKNVSSTDFNINKKTARALYANGVKATEKMLQGFK